MAVKRTFRDANYQEVEYDGSPIHWRPSIYGLCLKNEQLLLIKHQDEQFFDVPGGGVEMEESLEEALRRESLEEAGWELRPIKPLLTQSEWFYHNEEKKFYKSLQLYFAAEGEQVLDAPTDSRIATVQLVAIGDLSKYKLYPNLEQALAVLLNEKTALTPDKVAR